MYAGLPVVTFKDASVQTASPLEDCLAHLPIVYMHHCFLKMFVAPADSFPDNSADLQELFKLLEGTSHVEHQSVSRQAWH